MSPKFTALVMADKVVVHLKRPKNLRNTVKSKVKVFLKIGSFQKKKAI